MKIFKFMISLSFFAIFSACSNKTEPLSEPIEALKPTSEKVIKTEKDTQNLPEFKIEVQKVNGKTTWVNTQNISVKPGEKFRFTAVHELEGGPSFHGLSVSLLGIQKQVNRGKAFSEVFQIPMNTEAGDYEINCQFHNTHVGTKITVTK